MAIASSNAITYEKIYSQSHANLYNLINTRSNVPDPADSSGNRKFVYVREPRTLGRNFAGYPCIIIPSFSVSQSGSSVDRRLGLLTYEVNIRIWTQDRESNSVGNPSGAEQLNTISDDIIETLNNKTNRDLLRVRGMSNFEIVDSDFDWDEIEGKTLYMREFTIIFSRRLMVAA
jgi:hypothetical protein